ncbi:MAG: PilT/PilU family type 4a pilus ATPase [Fimbriimonadaceae bacterium]|nr:PilT/PilU family type 4a pilus ATPase [Fimbriimonadaceae bacterium]QYK54815.1 MAG: PilT/PilU family type 4a pilus ATPase [Fimbriimonadaceae bacterium]
MPTAPGGGFLPALAAQDAHMREPASIELRDLIQEGYDLAASDVMIKCGHKPMIKQYSAVKAMPGEWPTLDEEHITRMLYSVMNERQRKKFEATNEMDLAFHLEDKCRVRTNVYRQRGGPAAVMRIIPSRMRSLEELGLPTVLGEQTKHRQGLILVTGPTGSGKTTTLAALIDIINSTRPVHIVTIEDPLEIEHQDKTGYVSQREVGMDTDDFMPALRAVVREAPDVILIGEMRDTTTMHAAMQAGETGHLVFSSVHTASAYETLDRIINMFPPHEKAHLCQRLANSLRGIIAQKLVPRADGNGRVVVPEILICTPTVSKAIEDGHFGDLYHLMNEGGFWGMQTMNQGLARYVKAGIIAEEVALNYAGIVSELKQMLRR